MESKQQILKEPKITLVKDVGDVFYKMHGDTLSKYVIMGVTVNVIFGQSNTYRWSDVGDPITGSTAKVTYHVFSEAGYVTNVTEDFFKEEVFTDREALKDHIVQKYLPIPKIDGGES